MRLRLSLDTEKNVFYEGVEALGKVFIFFLFKSLQVMNKMQ